MSQNNQEFKFDKFVKDLEERENAYKKANEVLDKQEAEWQARELRRRYREHPLHCIIRKPGDAK